MNVTGIIAEYNPFHNGHLFHLHKSKQLTQADCIVVAMSGNIMQRGEFAAFSKWRRTEWAIRGGADLIIEIPVVFSCASAAVFAFGGIDILNKTGVINSVCFGSESDDIPLMTEIADFFAAEPPEFQNLLLQYLKKYSYAAARAKAAAEMLRLPGSVECLSNPNNILGIEYIRALKRLKSKIQPYTIKRQGSGYNESNFSEMTLSSATAIRKHHDVPQVKYHVPEYVFETLQQDFSDHHYLYKILQAIICSYPQNLAQTEDSNEFIAARLVKSVNEFDLKGFYEKAKHKSIDMTRLRRVCMYNLLNFRKEDSAVRKYGVQYLRILGFSEKGRKLLRTIKKRAPVPIITNPRNIYRAESEIGTNEQYDFSPDVLKKMISYDVLSADLFNIISGHAVHPGGDYLCKPVMASEYDKNKNILSVVEKNLTD